MRIAVQWLFCEHHTFQEHGCSCYGPVSVGICHSRAAVHVAVANVMGLGSTESTDVDQLSIWSAAEVGIAPQVALADKDQRVIALQRVAKWLFE